MAYDATFERVPLRTIFDLKGERATVAQWLGDLDLALPAAPNTSMQTGDAELMWIGPDHWLLRAPLEDVSAR